MIQIDRETFKELTPGSNFQPLFEDASTVKLISFDKDANLDYGTREVAGFKVEVDGVEKMVPAPAVLGAVVNAPGVVQNEGHEVLECLNIGKFTFHEILNNMAKDSEKIEFPSEIKIIRRVQKGIAKSAALPRKNWYEESHLTEDGEKFSDAFKDLDYIPTLFKNEFGAFRTTNAYLIEPID